MGGNSTKATSGINGAGTQTQQELGIPDSAKTFFEDTKRSVSPLNIHGRVWYVAGVGSGSGMARDWQESAGRRSGTRKPSLLSDLCVGSQKHPFSRFSHSRGPSVLLPPLPDCQFSSGASLGVLAVIQKDEYDIASYDAPGDATKTLSVFRDASVGYSYPHFIRSQRWPRRPGRVTLSSSCIPSLCALPCSARHGG